MSAAATTTSGQGGINPNVPVGAEKGSESRANSVTTFDQVEEVMDAQKPQKGSRKPAERKDQRADGDEDESGASRKDDVADKAPKKPARKDDDKEGADTGDKDGAKDKKDGERPPAKPKVHKLRSGDKELDVSGDSVVRVPVDGKHEEVSFQDLVNEYSGKKYAERKISEVTRREKEHTEKVTRLNGVVEDLFKRAESDPDDALDWLAEMSGKDAVDMRDKMLRQQYEAMKPIFDMTDDERERFFQDRMRDSRDRVHQRREKARADKEAAERYQGEVTSAKQRYGIDDDAFTKAEDLALKFLQSQQGYKGEKPSVEQVVGAQRYVMVRELIDELVPHLAKHSRFGDIVRDVHAEALKHPELNRDKLGKLLKDTFGEDNETLRKVARKANAQADRDDTRQARTSDSSKKQPLTFDDI